MSRTHSGEPASEDADAPLDAVEVVLVTDLQQHAPGVPEFLEGADDRISVQAVHTAGYALARVRRGDVDCVVSGLDLARTDWSSFHQRLRAADPNLPLLVLGDGASELPAGLDEDEATQVLSVDADQHRYGELCSRIRAGVREYRVGDHTTRTERRLRELVEYTDVVLWMTSADWSELYFVNERYETVFGRSIQDLQADPMDVLNAVHPEDRDRVARSMETQSPEELEFRVNEREDYGRWVRAYGEPIRDDDGDVVRLAGYAREITDRKQRERELEQRRSILEAVAESSLDGILVVRESEVVLANSQFGDMLDVRDHLLEHGSARTVLDAMTEAVRRPPGFERTVQALAGDRSETVRDVVEVADGRTLDCYTTPVTTDDGTYHGRVWYFRDVSDVAGRPR